MLADFGRRLADRLAAERDQFVGAMKLEHADVADLDLHQRVGRIAGEPRAHDAVLENVERADHRGHEAGRRGLSVEPSPRSSRATSGRSCRCCRAAGSSPRARAPAGRTGLEWRCRGQSGRLKC